MQDADDRIDKLHAEIKKLIEYYNSVHQEASEVIGCKLNLISVVDNESVLNQLIAECDLVIDALENDTNLFSVTEKNKLDDLKEEATSICEKLDVHFGRNIEESLMELEKGHFLASALITSRVVDYTLTRIKGEKIEDKIKNLIETNAIEEYKIRQQQTEKISRLTRNLYIHRIDIYPKSSEAFSLLGDCIFLLDLYAKTVKSEGK